MKNFIIMSLLTLLATSLQFAVADEDSLKLSGLYSEDKLKLTGFVNYTRAGLSGYVSSRAIGDNADRYYTNHYGKGYRLFDLQISEISSDFEEFIDEPSYDVKNELADLENLGVRDLKIAIEVGTDTFYHSWTHPIGFRKISETVHNLSCAVKIIVNLEDLYEEDLVDLAYEARVAKSKNDYMVSNNIQEYIGNHLYSGEAVIVGKGELLERNKKGVRNGKHFCSSELSGNLLGEFSTDTLIEDALQEAVNVISSRRRILKRAIKQAKDYNENHGNYANITVRE